MPPFAIQERINLVSDIKSIINDYPSDSSLFKEFLQNSDDAGATRQVFTLDWRSHKTSSLVDASLSETQGPALFCENDSVFDESNWKAITTTHSSDKTADFSKTGKYGVGFRSCYHITDNPHILSKDTLVVLDPHYDFHDKEIKGGARITLSTDGRSYADQLAAFAPILPLPADLCSSSDQAPPSLEPLEPFPGTIIRLPLRTKLQARTTEIKPGAFVTAKRIKSLVEEFVLEEAATCLLFLKNIVSIEFREIEENGLVRFLAKAEVTNSADISERRMLASRPSSTGEASTVNFPCQITTSTSAGGLQSRSWIICHAAIPPNQTAAVMTRRLTPAVAKYGRLEGQEMEKSLANEKFAGHVALAFALDDDASSNPAPSNKGAKDDRRGRLFTLLPLPIYTDFPLHLNGAFALMSNRQGLDTIEGKQSSLHSREWLRVQWNYAIFEDLLPGLWAYLLNTIEGTRMPLLDPYRPFPRPSTSSGHNCYWTRLPQLVFEKAIEKEYRIFRPVNYHLHGRLQEGKTMRLRDVLVSYSDKPTAMAILPLLGKIGIPIVKPPQHVLQVLEQLSCSWKKECPNDVALFMKENKARVDVTKMNAAEKNELIDYLLDSRTTITITRVADFPLLPTVGGQYTTLPPPSPSLVEGEALIIVTEEEEKLFSGLPTSVKMVSLSALSATATTLLRHTDIREYANITKPTPELVLGLLRAKLASSTLASAGRDSNDVRCKQLSAWLLLFWKWAADWVPSHLKRLMANAEVTALHLLPTSVNTVRRVDDKLINAKTFDAAAATPLEALGVPFSHKKLSLKALRLLAQLGFVAPSNAALFVLDHIQVGKIAAFTPEDRSALRTYFQENLKGVPLEGAHRTAIHCLPLFPVLSPGTSPTPDWAAIQGRPVFVRVAPRHPLPVHHEDPITYVDLNEAETFIFIKLITPPADFLPVTDLMLLEDCIPNLESQPLPLLDSLFSRIVHRMTDLSSDSLAKLRTIKCIPVNGGERRSASEVIDPTSMLAELFRDETGKFPVKPYSEEKMLATLRSHRMVLSQLEGWIVEERVQHVGSFAAEETNPPAGVYSKARALLRLLDKEWIAGGTSFVACTSAISSRMWLPCSRQGQRLLCTADSCRDSEKESPALFDLNLLELDGRIKSPGLREALGWHQSLPFAAILSQLKRTFEEFYPPDCQRFAPELMSRLKNVTEHLNQMFNEGRVSEDQADQLRNVIGDRSWVEVSGSLVATRYLALSENLRFEEGLRVKMVPRRLVADWKAFLTAMGVPESPPIPLLIEELHEVAKRTQSTLNVTLAVNLLEAIASQCSPTLPAQFRAEPFHLLVPDDRDHLVPMDRVCYNDIGKRSDSRKLMLHAKVSGELAAKLGIAFASSSELGYDDEDPDDKLEMTEDLNVRIRTVLQNYDVSTALNEFLANAVDAGATRFSILLDERSHNCKTVMTTVMESAQNEALVLHNDATFTDEDFKGICKIGEGGKIEVANTIGRFGVGSLSMFHFTDVAVIVSGGYLLILNPSGQFLPPRVNGQKRTVLKRRIDEMQERYPDVLQPFHNVFGFSTHSSEYCGTIFRLPLLRKSANDCQHLLSGDYLNLAKCAFFFNALAEVSASHFPKFSSALHQMWSVTAKITPSRKAIESGDGLRSHCLHLRVQHDKSPAIATSRRDVSRRQSMIELAETWLIVRSDSPMLAAKEHTSVLIDYRYHTNTHLTTHLALCLSSPPRGLSHHFFARLMLPHKTGLPFHLDAPFALSQDRRNIRFDTGEVLAYNTWLLTDNVPRLHHFALSHIVAADANKNYCVEDWWPVEWRGEPDNHYATAFYRTLPDTEYPICLTALKQPIRPKDAIFPLYHNSEVGSPTISRLFWKLQIPNFVDLAPTTCKIIRQMKVGVPGVTATLVRDILLEQGAEVIQLFNDRKITAHEVEHILEFMLDANPKVSPSTTPLLLTEDGLKKFDPEGPIVYDTYAFYGSKREHVFVDVFPQSRFLSTLLLRNTAKLLLNEATSRIKELTTEGLVSLIREVIPEEDRCQHPTKQQHWIAAFLNSDDLHASFYSDLMNSAQFCRLPLFALQNETSYVSLTYARNHCLRPSHLRPELGAIMQKMGLIVLKAETKFEQRFTSSSQLPNLSLESFAKHSISKPLPWQVLSALEHKQLATWIKNEMHENVARLNNTLAAQLSTMPLWEARRKGAVTTVMTPANSLHVLKPGDFDLEILLEFTRDTVAIAPPSSLMTRLRGYGLQDITPNNISRLVDLPVQLPEDQHVTTRFRRLLQDLLVFAPGSAVGSTVVMVPNTQCELKHPRDLFDSSVGVFRLALERTQSLKLIHHAFEDMQIQLRVFGLAHIVNVDTLAFCAQTLSAELEGRQALGQPVDEHKIAADAIYEQYTTALPSLIPISTMGASQWRRFGALSFIPRREDRRYGLLYDPTAYCTSLPTIISPDSALLPSFESICWTQRGCLRDEPPVLIQASGWRFGAPNASEVVAHLRVLATKAMRDHPGSDALLRDLNATYKWLDEHCTEAREHLILLTAVPLFLNVDDTEEEQWRWNSAEQLVLGLRYDTGTLSAVRGHLLGYKDLLPSAGVQTLADAKYQRKQLLASSEAASTVRRVFNEMRQQEELADLELLPSRDPQDEPLHCHRAFMAASIPYFRDAFGSGMAESNQSVFRIEGTGFIASAYIEYVYTGRMEIREAENGEQASELLENLLGLLEHANLAQVDDLKELAGWHIHEQALLTPDTLEEIKDAAANARCESLQKYCDDYARKNESTLLALSREEAKFRAAEV